MDCHNAIVILFDGNLPSDRDIAKIATIVGGQNIRINVMSSEDLSKYIASLAINAFISAPKTADRTIDESLRQSLIFIKERYSNELHNRSIFVDKLACDLFNANRKIGKYGCESDSVKEDLALLTAIKTIADTGYDTVSNTYWKEFDISKEIYNHIRHFSQMCYV